MAHKTITISVEAYKALKSLKEKGESFTATILRLTRKKKEGTLLEYIEKMEPAPELADILEEITKSRHEIRLREVEF